LHNSIPTLSILATSRLQKLRSLTYTIYMTSGPMKSHGSNLDCFKPQASSSMAFQCSSANLPRVACFQVGLSSLLAAECAFKKRGCT
jgi:hypothetical protein